jgi:hypothetical protein
MTRNALQLVIVTGSIATIIMIGIRSLWPEAGEILIGKDFGVLSFATAAATVAFVAFNAIISQKNLANTTAALEQSRKAEAVLRFQRASEMLGSNLLATRVAGVLLLQELAQQQPEAFFNTVLNLLIVFAEERTQPAWNAVQQLHDTIKERQESSEAEHWNTAFKQTPEDVLAAVSAIGKLRSLPERQRLEEQWIGKGEKLWLRRVILVDRTLRDCDFSRMDIEGGLLCNVNFANCRFVETAIGNVTIIETAFNSCDLSRARIACESGIATPSPSNGLPKRRLSFRQTNLDQATIRTDAERIFAIDVRGTASFEPTSDGISLEQHVASNVRFLETPDLESVDAEPASGRAVAE